METTKKMMMGIEGKSGATFDEDMPGLGLSLGVMAIKRMGEHLVAETGLEGGYFHPASTSLPGKGPVGAFLGGGIFHQFADMAFIATLRGRTGYDFSRETPYGGAELGTKLMFEMRGKDGIAISYPFIGLNGGYVWDGKHGGQVFLTAGFLFDLGE